MEHTLNDGRTIVIRNATQSDAAQVVSYMKQVVNETKNLAYEPDEFTLSVKQEKAFLKRVEESPNECMIVGIIDDTIVSVAGIHGSMRRRLKHRVDLGISVLLAYHNLGIGRHMMTTLIEIARQMNKRTIELEVRCDNEPAIALYHSLGFVQEGIKKDRFYVDGIYIDNILMAKHLEDKHEYT